MTKPSKTKKPIEEKFENQDLDLFQTLDALDKKNYDYLDNLSEEQRRKFVPYMMTHWMSQVKADKSVQSYHVLSTNHYANKYLFNEYVQKHPKLQWLMLCASSPGIGKQFHQWVPHLSDKITKLKDKPSKQELKTYYQKIYPKISADDLDLVADAYLEENRKKLYLAKKFTDLKIADIEILSKLITDEEIEQYERDFGN